MKACWICRDSGMQTPAVFKAAQSSDAGKTVTWGFICELHATGWNDGGDWNAPVVRIKGGK